MNVNRRELLRSLVAAPVAAAVGASLPVAPAVGDGVLAWAYLPRSKSVMGKFDFEKTWIHPGAKVRVECYVLHELPPVPEGALDGFPEKLQFPVYDK